MECPLTLGVGGLVVYNDLTNIELMNPTLLLLISNAVSIISVIGAIILASKEKEGWFVFVLLALFCFKTPTIPGTL